MILNIDITTKICCTIATDYGDHMRKNISNIREDFSGISDKDILYLLFEKTIEILQQDNAIWN